MATETLAASEVDLDRLAAMALAPAAYALWTRFLRFDPADPEWFERDRFMLSNGHASVLQYAVLHLTGYPLAVRDLKQQRQWGSHTRGTRVRAHAGGGGDHQAARPGVGTHQHREHPRVVAIAAIVYCPEAYISRAT